MILKKKILSNEFIKRSLANIKEIDKKLFLVDINKEIDKSYNYKFINCKILPDGKLYTLNQEIIKDYLSFNSISKFIFLKKIILSLNYFLKLFIQDVVLRRKKFLNNGILAHNRNSYGYYHWILDTLPKLIFFKKKNKSFQLILPKNLDIKFIKQSLNEFKINYIFLDKNKKYYIKNLTYLGELYPSGSPRPKILSYLRDEKKRVKNLRIFISRNLSSRRKIVNEKKVFKILKKYNFKIVHCEKLSFLNQIKLFSSANFVIGLHGAGLANILWMKKNSHILELRPEKDLYLNSYFNLSQALNVKYDYLICRKNNKFRSSKYADYIIDEQLLKIKIKEIINNE